jgi:hypothetical protein
MTRKDYVAIAAVFKAQMIRADAIYNEASNADMRARGMLLRAGMQSAAEGVCHVMAADNPRFDRARFLKACGVQS